VTARDRPNPLAHALDEAAATPEARAYAVPVERVRGAVRRRRAWRTTGVAALALVVVAGGAGVVRAGLDSGFSPSTPGGAGSAASAADWPAQFGRCGQPADEVLPDVGADGMSLTLADEPATLPADGTWTATATLDRSTGGTIPIAVLWGTDLTVVRDGVVVGVQDGPQVPDLSQGPADSLGGPAPTTSPFPLVTDVSLGLNSCDPYPSGTGSADLAPGTYDLVVTQTISWAAPGPGQSGAAAAPLDSAAGGSMTDARVSAHTTVTITQAGVPKVGGATSPPTTTTAQGLTVPTDVACGATTDGLTALTDERSNPTPFRIRREDHSAPAGSPFTFTARLESTGTATATVSGADAVAVFAQDGLVVGHAALTGEAAAGTADPGETLGGYGGWDTTYACGGDEDLPSGAHATLQPGVYDLWFLLDAHVTAPRQQEARVASGPWALTLADPATPRPGDDAVYARDARYDDATGAVLRCGEPVDALAAGSPGLALDAEAAGGDWTPLPPGWTGTVSATDGRAHTVRIESGPRLAILDQRGTQVIGFAQPSPVYTPGDARYVVTSGSPASLGGWRTWDTYGCDGTTLSGNADDVVAGPRMVVPYVVVDDGQAAHVLLGSSSVVEFRP
jgi:hypothetical protein